jgi:Putative MetA-pathway of phenol degradation
MAWASPARAADDDAITPYRPSVSSPAQLPLAGQLEFELGGLQVRAADTRRRSLPYLFKLAFSKEWGLLVGGELHVWSRQGSDEAQGVGDTVLTAKRAWIVDEASALGLELGTKLPTANDRIGSGKADYSANAIVSRDIGAVHIDANLNVTRLGMVEAGTSSTQIGASASFSTALAQRWGLTGEVSGTRRSGADSGLQVLTALSYSPSKRLTIDIGIARAMRPAPSAISLFTGAVMPLARLW